METLSNMRMCDAPPRAMMQVYTFDTGTLLSDSPVSPHHYRDRVKLCFCGAAWQAACRLATGTRGDCQSPRRMPSCPTEIAPFLTVTVLGARPLVDGAESALRGGAI